jgi:hypothetical protein
MWGFDRDARFGCPTKDCVHGCCPVHDTVGVHHQVARVGIVEQAQRHVLGQVHLSDDGLDELLLDHELEVLPGVDRRRSLWESGSSSGVAWRPAPEKNVLTSPCLAVRSHPTAHYSPPAATTGRVRLWQVSDGAQHGY